MTSIPATKDEAEVRELNARAYKAEVEAQNLLLEQDLRKAEILRTQAEARRDFAKAVDAENYAAMSRMNLDTAKRNEEITLVSDYYMRHYMFDDEVNYKSVNHCLQQLEIWHRRDAKIGEFGPMNITIDSPGGDVVGGMHLFDEVANYSQRGGGEHFVTMTVRGYAASMAGILLQAADDRVMGKRAYLLIHQVSAWAGGSLGEIKDKVKWLDLMSEHVVDIFMERSGTKIDRATFESKWERSDWWLNADQSLAYGFVDRLG